MVIDEKYMRRALQLAALSPYTTHPNPMVGAVIVARDRIIGEGWHRRCGEAHAEVNAVAAVSEADRYLLREATIYVTLEPCSHYGKTPPCSKLIIDSGLPRVVVGAVDPFGKVAGRGIAMLREAGIEVVVGVLAEETRRLNRRFFTAHTLRRPFITLKWAQSVDGFMDADRLTTPGGAPFRFSTPLSSLLTHRERASVDAIVSTVSTVEADNARLDTRLWAGPSPRRVIVDTHIDPNALMHKLYSQGVTSVLVEAGPRFMQSMIDADLWDDVRIETSPVVLGSKGRHRAPSLLMRPDYTDRIVSMVSPFHTSLTDTSSMDSVTSSLFSTSASVAGKNTLRVISKPIAFR